MNKLTHTNGQDRWIHRWIDRSVGRWIFCIVSFYFTNCPTPPSLGSALHGQHPHNSVYAIYLSVSTQTAFNLFLLPLHMSVDTPTFIHAHTDLSYISYYPKRKMCSQRLQPLSCILSSFSTSIFVPFCVDTSNNKIYCQNLLATSSWIHVLYHAQWQLPFLTYRPFQIAALLTASG